MLILIFLFSCALNAIIIRAVYLLFFANGKILNKPNKCSAKTLIVLGSGGHTTEMLKIVEHLKPKRYTPRIYIHADSDKLSNKKVKEFEGNNSDYKIVSIPRSRGVRQSYFTSIWSTVYATFSSIPIIWNEAPDLLLCNGPGTCPIMLEYAKITTESINWNSLMEDLTEHIPNEIKIHLLNIITELRIQKIKENGLSWVNKELLRTESCLDRCWETLNSGHWIDVPIVHRYAYTFSSLIKVILLEIHNHHVSKDSDVEVYKEIIKQVDKGLLLGAPLPRNPSTLTTIASRVNAILCNNTATIVDQETLRSEECNYTIYPGFHNISEYNEPSMETFNRDIFVPKVPAKLTGCMKHWQALNLWKDPQYLQRIVGSRMVPIEVGSRYTDEDWTQKLITFADFLRDHISNKNNEVGYLAQHQLFEQV